MKKTILTVMIGILTAGSFFSSLSQARGPDDGQHRSWHQQQGGRDHRSDDRHADHHHGGRGERNYFSWRGDDFRLGHPAPERYRGSDYRIDDWGHRGLDAPPRGAHWAYIDGNYVLMAAATGIVTAIIIGGLSGNH